MIKVLKKILKYMGPKAMRYLLCLIMNRGSIMTMIKKKRKWVLAVTLMAILFTILLTVLITNAEEVSYQPKYLISPLFTANSKSSLDMFISESGTSPFNWISRFYDTEEPSSHLWPGSIVKTGGDYGGAIHSMSFSEAELKAAQKGDLSVFYKAILQTQWHMDWNHHRFEHRLSYPVSILEYGYGGSQRGNQVFQFKAVRYETGEYTYYTQEDSGTGAGTNTKKFIKLYPNCYNTLLTGLNLHNYGLGCECHSTHVRGMQVLLADEVSPAVKSIYTTMISNPDGNKETCFLAGETMYIHLKFDEYIRFADDKFDDSQEGEMELIVHLKRIVDDVEESGIQVKADFVGLVDDTLTFQYEVPAVFSVGGSERITNYYLDRIAYNEQTTWISADNSKPYDLLYPYQPMSDMKRYINLSEEACDAGLNKTTSLITDLAGNPVDIASSRTSFDNTVYMDNVEPFVEGVSVHHIQKNPHNASVATVKVTGVSDRGNVFMTEGDIVGVMVDFSEEIFVDSDLPAARSQVFAETNIEDGAGELIVLGPDKLTGAESINNGVNGTKITRLHYAFTVPAGAKPTDNENPLAVKRIYTEDGHSITDTRRNSYTLTTDVPAPDEQLWLDTIKPSLDLGNLVPDGPGGDNSAFYIKVDISDVEGIGGNKNMSGTNGAIGCFRWENVWEAGAAGESIYTFEYRFGPMNGEVTGFNAARTWEDIPFTQVDSEDIYLYIKYPEGEDVSISESRLVFSVYDITGNEWVLEKPLDGYFYDNIGTVIIPGTHEVSYSGTDHVGLITVPVTVRDVNSTVEDIQYQWAQRTTVVGEVYQVAPAIEENYISVDPSNITETFGGVKEFTLTSEELTGGEVYWYDLYIRTIEDGMSGEPVRVDYKYDLSLPKYTLKCNKNPDDPIPKHSIDFYGAGSDRINENGTTIVMIKRLGYEDQYWVKTSLLRGYGPSPDFEEVGSNYNDIFAIPSREELEAMIDPYNGTKDDEEEFVGYFGDWYLSTVAEDVYGNIEITKNKSLALIQHGLMGYENPIIEQDEQFEISDLFNKTYGELTVELLSVYPDQTDIVSHPDPNYTEVESIALEDTDLYWHDSMTLKFAAEGNAVHTLTDLDVIYEGENSETTFGENGLNSDFSIETMLDGGAPLYFKTPKTLLFNISPNTLMPAWGMADIDFANSHVDFDNGITTPLIPSSSSQTVIIPQGLDEGVITGNVVLAHKGSSEEESHAFSFTNDSKTIDTFGVSGAVIDIVPPVNGWIYDNRIIGTTPFCSISTNYGLSSGQRTNEIFISEDMDMLSGDPSTYNDDMMVNFDALRSWEAPGNKMYLKIWNPDTGNTLTINAAGEASAGDGWWETYRTSGEYPGDPAADTPEKTYRVSFFASDLLQLAGENGVLQYEFMLPTYIEQLAIDEYGNTSMQVIAYTTPVQALMVHSSDSKTTLEMYYHPDYVSSADITASVSELASDLVSPSDLTLLYMCARMIEDYPVYDPCVMTMDEKLTIDESISCLFVAHDKYMNYSIDGGHLWIDNEAPELENVSGSSPAGSNLFSITARINDDLNKEDTRLAISIDESDETYVPEMDETGEWLAQEQNENGIYSCTTSIDNPSSSLLSRKVFNLEGMFPYNDTVGEGTDVMHTVVLRGYDTAGNAGSEQTVSITAKNIKPAYKANSCSYDVNNGLSLEFNMPVLMKTTEESESTEYSTLKTNLPIYENGEYDIEFTDIYGQSYTETIDVDAFDKNVEVKISETSSTNKNVFITLDSTGTDVVLTLPSEDLQMDVEVVSEDDYGIRRAEITVRENRDITFGVSLEDGSNAETRTIKVNNIDKTPPTAALDWVFTADVNKQTGETMGEVTVSLAADEPITGTDGNSTKHTFAFGGQESHTFYFSDMAGNAGEPLTASLSDFSPAVVIVEKTIQEMDSTPPEYTMQVHIDVNGSFASVAQFTQASYEAMSPGENPFSNEYFITRQMKLDFYITDENQTRLLLLDGTEPDVSGLDYESSEGDTINGIHIRDHSVSISENAAFTVAILDKNNNCTLVPVQVMHIDSIAPAGTVEYDYCDFAIVRAYLEVSDDKTAASDIRILNPEVKWDSTKEKYYYAFTSNGSYTFQFMDRAGNIGEAPASITTLDTSTPVLTSQRWSPGSSGVNQSGDDIYQPPILTNKTLTAQLGFDKTIQKVIIDEAFDESQAPLAAPYDSYFTIDNWLSGVTINFIQGVELKLSFIARNGKSLQHTLDVTGIIDKKAPCVTAVVSEDTIAVRSVTITYTSDETVTCIQTGQTLDDTNGYEYTMTVVGNGTYTRSFTDAAGNITVKTVTVSNIDSVAPTLTLSGVPACKGEDGALPTTVPVTVTASSSENGVITLNGEEKTVTAGGNVTFTIGKNGAYVVSACDGVGNVMTERFVVDTIDNMPPSIMFTGGVIKLPQGTLVSELEAAALIGVKVYDGYDGISLMNKFSISGLGDVDLDTPGIYTLTYTVIDTAGNEGVATRKVYVYDKNRPMLFINDKQAENGETITSATKSLNIAISLPDTQAGEPCKLYYAEGCLTEGQIKTAGVPLDVDGSIVSFTTPRHGFYTIYLLTQSRHSVIVWIYVG